ncbi:MAG: GtrA family protein [Erysipelotrichaceae bacterium]|nr:GtrA family protein [Erysipelotrichaceae bacterium]MBQ1522289.1 GtrA family protein [Erysipelotrichaceae bacterium]
MQKNDFIQAVKYTLIAASAGIIQFGSFTIFEEIFHWNYWPSYLTALVLSVLWNFTFNRKYTFHSSSNVPKAMFLVFLYYLVFTPLSTIVGDKLTALLNGKDYIVLIGTMIVNFVTEFLFQKYVVFKENRD